MCHGPTSPRRPRIAGAILLVLSSVAPACGPEPASDRLPGEVIAGPPLRVFETRLEDPLQLGLPHDMEVLDGRVYVAEAGNNRVTVTDPAFRLVHRFGQEGEGPGELRFPRSVKQAGDGRVMVVEIGNSRVSLFSREGEFIRSVNRTLPVVDAALLGDSRLVVPGVAGDFPPVMSETPTGPTPFSSASVAPAGENSPLVDEIFVMSTAQGRRVVLTRPVIGRFEVYDLSGALLRVDTLPATILGGVRDANREFYGELERQGHQMLTRKLMERAHATDDGRLVVRMRLSDPFAVLYDPDTGVMQGLYVEPEAAAREILRAAESLDVEKGELYALSRENLYAFELPPGLRR